MMKQRVLIAAALAMATLLGGCTTWQSYGYGYGPGYYVSYPGSYAYRYRPFYTPDYNGYYDTYLTAGGHG